MKKRVRTRAVNRKPKHFGNGLDAWDAQSDLRTLKRPTNLQLAYAAGIIDGEGSISLTWNSSRLTKDGSRPSTAPMLYLQMANTHRGVIDWFVRTFGVGTVIVAYRPKRPNHRTAYGWRVRNRGACAVLEMLLPYLIIKRPQAELGIRAQKLARKLKLGEEVMAERVLLRDQMLALNGTANRPRVLKALTTVMATRLKRRAVARQRKRMAHQ
jgi:hypothetical protein